MTWFVMTGPPVCNTFGNYSLDFNNPIATMFNKVGNYELVYIDPHCV